MLNRRWHWMGLAAVVAAGLACSSDKTDVSGSVTGSWCGLDVATAAACVGDEALFLQLTQNGTTVTGTFCEDSAKTDCYTLQDGTLVGGTLTFGWDIPPSDTVDGSFTLASDGKTLVGSLYSTKCNCDVPATLHRLD